MRQVVGLLVLLLLTTFSGAAAADCPDYSASCDTGVFGWQGSCLTGLQCKRCGPSHCPQRPIFKTSSTVSLKFAGQKVTVPRKSIALLNGNGATACRTGLIAKKWNPSGGSACSIPEQAKGVAGMADLVFGKSACVEHDVCYAMEGMNQELCDLMFLDNMLKGCDKYYYKHLGNRDSIKLLNGPGHLSCKVAARLFYSGVKAGGANSFNPSDSEKALCDEVSGPPVINTSLHLSRINTNGRIGRIAAKSHNGAADKNGKVKVCLVNKTKTWKGLHFKKASAAKYIAKKKDKKACGHYSPGKKTFYFWGEIGSKSEKKVNGSPIALDLNGYAGYRIDLAWYEN